VTKGYTGVKMAKSAERSDGNQAQVLIVEDEASIAAMLAAMLELEGYSSHIVHTGRAALDYLCPEWDRGDGANGATKAKPRHAPGLLLLDLHLGDMESVDLIRRLKKLGYRVPPVIILSARRLEAVATAASELGAADYFIKPADMDLLMMSIENVLS
jgi:DNA-binding response OmpR family regulator